MAHELTQTARAFEPLLKKDLAGYWQMEEALWTGAADEVVDSSGQGNHGTAKNGATTAAGGKLGRCGDFDAAQSHHLEIPISVFNQDEGSWSIWANVTWSTEPSVRLFNNLHSAGGNSSFRTQYPGGFLWTVGNGSALFNVNIGSLTDDVFSLVTFTWQYRAGTDDTEIKGYLNGVLKDTEVISGKIVSPDVALQIMRWSTTYTTGRVDELAVWERALPTGEIEVLYNSGAGVLIPTSESFDLPLEVVEI